MRLHAIAALGGASAMVVAIACGESLPASEDSHYGAVPVDAAADLAPDSDTTDVRDADAGDSGCLDRPAPCNAEEVADASPRAIAASPKAMIWLEGETVFALNPSSAPIGVMTAISNSSATGFLALQSFTALMTQKSGVNRCNTDTPCLADGGPAIGAPIFSLADTGPVAADSMDIFAADRGGERLLVTCGLAQSCNGTGDVVAYLPVVPTRLVLTTAFVVVGLSDKTLRAYPRSDRRDGGVPAPAPLATVGDLQGLAADGTSIYWADGAGGTISRCSLGTCASSTEVLASGRAFPRAIAISKGHAYWIETDADAVVRCTLPACADSTVLAKVTRPKDLAVGDRIYVASETVQRIYAIAP